MVSEFQKGDYVRIFDLAGYPHIGKIEYFFRKRNLVSIVLLSGLWANRQPDKIQKLTDGELMLLKLENA